MTLVASATVAGAALVLSACLPTADANKPVAAPATTVTTAPPTTGTIGTVGTTTIGALCDTATADTKRVSKYTLSTNAVPTSLSIYLKASATPGTQQLCGLIYADDRGAPGALVAQTTTMSFANTGRSEEHTS